MAARERRNTRRSKKRRPRAWKLQEVKKQLRIQYLDSDGEEITEKRAENILEKQSSEVYTAHLLDYSIDDLLQQLSLIEGLHPNITSVKIRPRRSKKSLRSRLRGKRKNG